MTIETNQNKLTFWIFKPLPIIISGLFAIMNLSEWYKIGILHETSGYPFGGEGPIPYYYKSAELYSTLNFVWGLLFFLTMLYGVWIVISKQRNKTIVCLGLTFFLLLAMFVYGQIGTN